MDALEASPGASVGIDAARSAPARGKIPGVPCMKHVLVKALVLLFASALPMWPGPVTAQAQHMYGKKKEKKSKPEKVSTVRFSYEKWSRTGKSRYVLVPATSRIKPGTFRERIRALFSDLVGAKRSSYGDARLAFRGDADWTGEVWVYLDQNKKQYHAIVMAEAVYTFTENGAAKVVFPKVAAQGWTRADVPFPAYVLTLPLWESLPPTRYQAALLELPDGGLLPEARVAAGLEKGDPALVNAMWSYVDSGPTFAALRAVEAAIHLKLPDLAQRLLPVLQSADVQLRKTALAGLAGYDTPDVNLVVRELMDSDSEAELRDLAALQLSGSKDAVYSTAAQYHALRSQDPKIVAQAATALGRSDQPEAGKQLIAVLVHADEEVRAAAVASLQKRGDHQALTERLSNGEIDLEIRRGIARALTAGNDAPAAHQGLLFLAVDGTGEDAARAAGRLSERGDPPTLAALGKTLKHGNADARKAAAAALAKIGKTEALPLLAAADTDDEASGPSVLDAIRTLYAGQPLEFVLKGTREKDPVLRRSAVATLGELVKRDGKKSKKQVVEALGKLAKDSEPEIRAAAARSFGVMADKSLEPDLMALAADDSVVVQRASARALKNYPGPDAVKHLLRHIQAQDAELVACAADALGHFKEREALNPVIHRLGHDDVRVRRAATGALVAIGSTLEKREPLLSFFSDRLFDDDTEVKITALEGLKLVKDKRTVTAMSTLLQDPTPNVRKATLLAVADTGDPAAVEAIASGLEDDDLSVRRTALDAFRKLNRKEALGVLVTYADGEKNEELSQEARQVIAAIQGS